MDRREYETMYHMENDYWWYVGLHELVHSFTQKHTSPGSLIFDAGCGTGRMMEILQKNYRVEGWDFSDQAIDYCRQRGLTSARMGNLNDFDLPPTYQEVISLDVLYHEAIRDDYAVINAFRRSLLPNGTLILNLPAFSILRRKHSVFVHEKRRYTKSVLLKLLNDNGWEIELATYRTPWLFCISLLIKCLEFFSNDTARSDLKPLHPWLNSVLLKLVRIENRLIALGMVLPFGSSLFIVARKK